MSGVWASFGDVRLVRADPDLSDYPGLRQALADGVERGFDGDLPSFPEQAAIYLLRADRSDVGLISIVTDCPRRGEAAVVALAIDPDARGNAYATKALMACERRLGRDGIDRVLTRVPRTNGRGLYFMLRAGFTPTAGISDDPSATWFERGGSY